VAVVERATLPDQRTVAGTLATIGEEALAADLRAPSITIVGAVATLAEELAWLPPRPLRGLTIAVTRARAQASGLAARLEALGARIARAPVIRTSPLPGPPLDPTPYDLVCLSSPVGVAAMFERLAAGGRDARALAGARLAAIGPGTAAALAEHGVIADIVPERAVAEGLLEALSDLSPPVRRALLARAREGRDVLPDGLRERGVEVEILALYETVPEPLSPADLAAVGRADYITFASSSAVRHFIAAASSSPEISPATRIVSIGPATSRTLREHGLEPHVEAAHHDLAGLIGALVADAVRRRAGEEPPSRDSTTGG
jgi:uroporphyrinogen III methyltransferase/synthase